MFSPHRARTWRRASWSRSRPPLSTLSGATTATDRDTHAAARARIRAYVDARLDDPHLTPLSIAAALGLSRGHLHRLYAVDDESLERYIWRRRLERVRADLTNPAFATLTIADLCSLRGFASAEHFSRMFRARYGVTAFAYRRGE